MRCRSAAMFYLIGLICTQSSKVVQEQQRLLLTASPHVLRQPPCGLWNAKVHQYCAHAGCKVTVTGFQVRMLSRGCSMSNCLALSWSSACVCRSHKHSSLMCAYKPAACCKACQVCTQRCMMLTNSFSCRKGQPTSIAPYIRVWCRDSLDESHMRAIGRATTSSLIHGDLRSDHYDQDAQSENFSNLCQSQS